MGTCCGVTGLLLIVLQEEIELPKRERFRGRAKGKQVASGTSEYVDHACH